MNDLSNQYAMAARRERRAEVSGEITTLKRRIKNLKATLLHLGGAIRVFDPGADPDGIPEKRFSQNIKPFAGGKMNRLIFTVCARQRSP